MKHSKKLPTKQKKLHPVKSVSHANNKKENNLDHTLEETFPASDATAKY